MQLLRANCTGMFQKETQFAQICLKDVDLTPLTVLPLGGFFDDINHGGQMPHC